MKHLCISVVLCVLLAACKKEKKPFSEYEGNWKPVSFQYSEGTKAFPADFSYSISQGGDTLLYRYLKSKSPIIEETIAYKLEFSIRTFIKDNSVLVIDELYMGLDSMGKVVKTISNKNEVSLVEGQEAYGHSPNNQIIKSDRIETNLYTTSGTQFMIRNSKLVKME